MFRIRTVLVSLLIFLGIGLSTQAFSQPTKVSRPSTTQSSTAKSSTARTNATPAKTATNTPTARRASSASSSSSKAKSSTATRSTASRNSTTKKTNTSSNARRVTSSKPTATRSQTTTTTTRTSTRQPARYVAVSKRTYVLPSRTRPTRIYSRQPIVIYSANDTLALRREISDLRVAIQQERVRTGLYIPSVDASLNDALVALDETESMLRWGYSRTQVRAGIADARSLLSYARSERDYVWSAVDQYRTHAQAQLALAERNLVYSTYRASAMRDIDAARRAIRDAEATEIRRLSADEIISSWQRAADYADRAAFAAMS